MTQVRANKIKYALSNSAFSVASLCIGGTLMQTFLGEIGLTDRIWLHASILQIAGVAGTMVFSHSGDRGNVFRRAALSSLPIAALYFFYIPLCVFPVPTAASFGIAAALGLVQTLLTGIRTICDFKFPYRIIPMEEYGSLLAWYGIAGGLSTMAVGALFGWLARRFPFPALMCWAFPAAAVLTALGALLTLSMKPVEE